MPCSEKLLSRSASSSRVSLRRTTRSSEVLQSLLWSQNCLYLNWRGSDESPTTTWYEYLRVDEPLPDRYVAQRSFPPTSKPNTGGDDSLATTGALNCNRIDIASPRLNMRPWSFSSKDTSSNTGLSPSTKMLWLSAILAMCEMSRFAFVVGESDFLRT